MAYCTLLTSDSYLPGVLVVAASLRSTGTKYPLNILATPESLSPECINILKNTFDNVIPVSCIRSQQHVELDLLGRKELDVTFTKIHCWNSVLFPYDKMVFLDADVLVLENIDSLFDYIDGDVAFAAAPDIGWPDCFNSGVFVMKPNMQLYQDLLAFSSSTGSFDGGDQGLLNSFFSSWSGHSKNNNSPPTARLPFTFNVTPSTFYSYLPAFAKFSGNISCIHFIGKFKPWLYDRYSSDGSIIPQQSISQQTLDLIKKWWDIFDSFQLHSLMAKTSLPFWKQYIIPTNLQNNTNVQNNNITHSFSNSKYSSFGQDLQNFKVGWNAEELKSVRSGRRSLSRSSNGSKLENSPTRSIRRVSRSRPPSPIKSYREAMSSNFGEFLKSPSTASPSTASPSPTKVKLSPYEIFEKSVSNHAMITSSNPPANIEGYKITWNKAEISNSKSMGVRKISSASLKNIAQEAELCDNFAEKAQSDGNETCDPKQIQDIDEVRYDSKLESKDSKIALTGYKPGALEIINKSKSNSPDKSKGKIILNYKTASYDKEKIENKSRRRSKSPKSERKDTSPKSKRRSTKS